MKPINVKAAGSSKELYCEPYGTAQCGNIKDGLSFSFKGEGAWVISLSMLERLVKLAKENIERKKESRE